MKVSIIKEFDIFVSQELTFFFILELIHTCSKETSSIQEFQVNVVNSGTNGESMHPRTENRLFTTSSDDDEGEPEQEQSEHAEAEHRLFLAGDRRDGT